MTSGVSNSAIADILERHGRLLEVAGESPFRTRAFTRAAESLRLYPRRVAEVAADWAYPRISGRAHGNPWSGRQDSVAALFRLRRRQPRGARSSARFWPGASG